MKQKQFFKQNAVRFKRFTQKAYSVFNSMHRVISIGVVTGSVLAVVHTTESAAQTAAKIQAQPAALEQELDEVMVTASRLELPVAQTPKPVTVITKEQIAQSPVRSIQDLLAYAANIDILRRGGNGAQADISIRGGSFDQTAVLVNGVNFSSAHTGHYSLDIPVNLSDIERIEIVHGPSALIYGSSAFSGGINIITKKKVQEKAYTHIESGMHNLKEIEVRGAAETGIASHSLSVGYKSSDGYAGFTNSDKYKVSILGGYAEAPMNDADNTGYDLYNLLWQTSLALKSQSKLDIQLGYNNKKYGANSFYTPAWPDQYERTSTYMGSVKGEFGSALKFIPIVYWNRHLDQFDLIKDVPWERNYHRADTYGSNLILQYTSALGITSLGAELRKEDILSSKLGKEMAKPHGKYTVYDDRLNTSATLEHTLSLSRFVFAAGLLANHNTFTGSEYNFYPSVSASYRPTESLKIASSWSKSARMPTFTELYYNTETHSANENLKPEKSESVDLSLTWHTSFVEARLTGFLLWGKDMIDWIKVNEGDKPSSSNLTKVNTQGIETSLRFHTAAILPVLGEKSNLTLAYTRMFQDYDAAGLISESAGALNYLRDKFTAQFNHRLYGNFSAGWYFRFQKRMGVFEKFENNRSAGRFEPYPAFSTLDLKLNYEYRDLAFNLSLNNLYDTRYFDLGNIIQPGFWLTGGISYTFK
ncbi:Outer membrane cobalamin translocator [Bacteroidales bacterium Barb6XT]|nr:Outer membrane cobalamin translocator [Bacteroidales bacterium Barb6XT]